MKWGPRKSRRPRAGRLCQFNQSYVRLWYVRTWCNIYFVSVERKSYVVHRLRRYTRSEAEAWFSNATSPVLSGEHPRFNPEPITGSDENGVRWEFNLMRTTSEVGFRWWVNTITSAGQFSSNSSQSLYSDTQIVRFTCNVLFADLKNVR